MASPLNLIYYMMEMKNMQANQPRSGENSWIASLFRCSCNINAQKGKA